ncbi:hypothetical protein C1T31_07780 [Hanstruepera neustonica]|uniref:Uncharacterized protein n=1 Tax=Hanstruepera neustonica TaxID=1445657 RepID=A0A2K1DZF3_9FLAO|nr:hypothetical protein [Hanstruepera neustonica]PNQ73403.1 hypothetical protein C1T31_07780 [Hanstruepera neustonica]
MKHLFYGLLLLTILSCGSDKIVQLPEIENATITEIHDVSPIYMFYDKETDSIEFNRKNMIGTTNWLVNIDKRLTLKQILPHLQYLQEKRHGDGMHKNENAKNYFTCHDLSINNLGFIEFTDVYYIMDESAEDFIEKSGKDYVLIDIARNVNSNVVNDLIKDLFNLKNTNLELNSKKVNVLLKFDNGITFQQYILVKSKLEELDNSKILIENNEFIY